MENPTGSTKKGVNVGWSARRPFALATETLIVFRGRVQWHRSGKYSVVKTKTAILRVWWAGGMLPPDIFVGQKIRALGKLVTYDEGRDCRVSDALPLTESWKEVMEPVFRQLWMYCADPAEWVPREVLDMYRNRSPLKRDPHKK